MSRSQVLTVGLVSSLAGVGLERFWPFGATAAALGLALGFVFCVFRRRWIVISVCLIGLSIGYGRAGLEPAVPAFPEQPAEFQGTIVRSPDVRKDHARLTVQLDRDETAGLAKPRLLVRTNLYPERQVGDRISFKCTPEQPELLGSFDYEKYLGLDGVGATCSARAVELVEAGRPSLNRMFASGRNWVAGRLNRLLPEPEAAFSAGLLIGARRSIPERITEAFQRTGTSHLVALSGFNITIIINLVMTLAVRTIGRRRAFWIVSLGILIFVLFVGSQASIVRAGIMGWVAALGSNVGRPSRASNALLLSAAVMVLVKPVILLDDLSFQLSFASTAGLMLLTPIIEPWLSFVPSKLGLKESLTATTSATVFTLPLILASFGRFSLVALPVNLLALPLIPLAMGLSALGLAASLFGLSVGLMGSLPAWLVLKLIIAVVSFFSAPAWAAVDLGRGVGGIAYGMYIPMLAAAYYINRMKRGHI